MTTIGIVGLGLIGGSLALAARRAGHVVTAWDAAEGTREQAAQQGLTVRADLTGAELVVLSVPMADLTHGLAATLAGVGVSDTATITDVGSLKQPVADAIRVAGLAERYVGGHPMAGTERHGFGAASPDLFAGKRWALCLTGVEPDVARWLQVAAVLTDVGAEAVAITPAEHDAAMATVSGLPHLLALGLSAAAADAGPLLATLAAGSFADLTRVAASDPRLLHAVIDDNQPALRLALRRLLDQLDRPWPDLIRDGNTAKDRLSRGTSAEAYSERGRLVVSGPRDLLEIGRIGGVIEAVDPLDRTIHYRNPVPPPRT